MSMDGLIELERSMDAIQTSYRHRTDLGDLDELCESMRQLGLLQPITIAPDGTLICGARRYEAARRLGWRTIKVWVRSGLSEPLLRLLAEQHENTMRKPYTPTEAARMYEELKREFQAEAQRNIRLTQFGEARNLGEVSGVPESGTPVRNAAKKAALAITGKRSEFTLERVLEVQRLADDPATPEPVRLAAIAQLEAMDAHGKVNGPYAQVKAAQGGHALETLLEQELPRSLQEETAAALRRLEQAESSQEILTQARAALERAQLARRRPARRTAVEPGVRRAPEEPRRYTLRAFQLTIDETDFWWLHYDPAEIGAALGEPQWEQFEDWVRQAVAFRDAAAVAR